MKYQINENVVHLSHGPGIVKGIEERGFAGGIVQTFYIIEITDNGFPKKLFVPLESAEKRLRGVIKKENIDEIYKILETKPETNIDHQTWNRRYREYMETIHSGNIKGIAQVIKSLSELKNEKDLSFGERKLFDQALTFLVREIAMSEKCNEKFIENKIKNILE